MSAKRTDILQIRKYLNGELDAAAMHRLEREAQDDPFLMEALEGYEADLTQSYPENDLDNLLKQRITEQKKRKVIPWKYYAAAASVLLFLVLGYQAWFNKQQPAQTKLTAANLPAPADHNVVKTDTAVTSAINAEKQSFAAANVPVPKHQPIRPELKTAAAPLQATAATLSAPTVYKADTVEYKASDYKVRPNATLPELLKKMEGTEVGADGSPTHQGQTITKVRINGKDYAAGDVQQVAKTLPADIIEKAQVVNDYGDQAARTGVKTKTDSLALKEVAIAGRISPTKKDSTGNYSLMSQTLLSKVKGVNVTTPQKISGTVYNDLGLALPGVSVLLDGTRNRAVTDDKGRFSIPANGQATLSVNSLGYKSKQVKAKANDSLKINLTPQMTQLNEVTITKQYNKTEKVITAAHPRMGWEEYNKYLKSKAISSDGSTVTLSFLVNAKGELSAFKVIKGSNDEVNQQAISLIKNGPAWYGERSGETKTIKLKIRFRKAPPNPPRD